MKAFITTLILSNFALCNEAFSVFSINFGKPSKPAQLQIKWNEDSIKNIQVISKSGKIIQTLDISGDWTNLGSETDRERKDIVKSVDANFDLYPDLLIESSSGSAGNIYTLFFYNPKIAKFERSTALDDVWNPVFDKKTKTVKGGANDMKPVTYRWVGTSLKKK